VVTLNRKQRRTLASKQRRALRLTDIEDVPLTVTVPQLAEILNCTRQHVWAKVKDGTIKTAVPLGRVIRITKPEVLRIYRGGLAAAK
jgi:excisionase family DNA binding protein